MYTVTFKRIEEIAAASPIAAYVDVHRDGAFAEVVLWETVPYTESSEIKRKWISTVTEMKALLVEWEAELDKRGIVR